MIVKLVTWVKADKVTEIQLNNLPETAKAAKKQGWTKKKVAQPQQMQQPAQ